MIKDFISNFKSKNIYGKLWYLGLLLSALFIGFLINSVLKAIVGFIVVLVVWLIIGFIFKDKLDSVNRRFHKD